MPTGNLRVALPPLAAGAFGYYANSDQTTDLDPMMLENIEALADDLDLYFPSKGAPNWGSCKISLNIGAGGMNWTWGTRSSCTRGNNNCYQGPCTRI